MKTVRDMIASGQLVLASERCAAILRSRPTDPEAWILAAEVALQRRRLADATDCLRRAAACAAEDVTVLVRCAVLLLRAGSRRDSLAIALRAANLPIVNAQAQDSLGALLTHHEEPSRALPLLLQAVQGAPANVDYRFNLAMVQRMAGEFEAAEDNLDRVIAARPFDAEAYLSRSELRKQTPARNHVRQLEDLLAVMKDHPARVPVGFALAKELEDLGESERSFASLREACRAHRATFQYDVAGDVAVLDALRTTHTSEALGRVQTDFDNQECIFIVGLPRSGTTLIDRMLGSHSAIFSAGELKAFPEAVIAAVNRSGGPAPKLQFVDRSLNIDFEQLGPAYVEATRPRTGNTLKFTDKLPLNYLYVGLIHAALPRARFVALRRQPLDSCYAMYKTLFVGAYPFSYDLGELGTYYLAWDRLMRHWEEVIGEAWLSVSYESLVSAPEVVCRQIVAHCGLPWEDACLQFHALRTPVTTASAVQVRRPLYSDSVGKWRLYADQLEPLARQLEEGGLLAPASPLR
jgi:tetratricopeptide (TPR) repeat protein